MLSNDNDYRFKKNIMSCISRITWTVFSHYGYLNCHSNSMWITRISLSEI